MLEFRLLGLDVTIQFTILPDDCLLGSSAKKPNKEIVVNESD